jgi:hypothetical protein
MPKHLNMYFNDYPAEGELISVMIAGYNELEFELSALLGYALTDINQGMRIFYRLRSESQRLQVADAIIRPRCETAGLSNDYAATYGALNWTKNTRNRYAHSQWASRGALCYFDMEEAAKTHSGVIHLDLKPVDVPLLEQQVEYFRYASRWLTYVSDEYRKRTEQLTTHDSARPKQMKQPPAHNPQD